MPAGVHLTTPIVWICTGILVILDVPLGIVALRLVKPDQFSSLTKLLTLAGGLFFLVVWTSALLWAWEWFYIYIFPPWARFVLPPVFCFAYAGIAFGMGWLSLKLPGNPAIIWCLLGGLEGFLSHLIAIYGLGAASNPPIMQGTDPVAVLIFAIFEKAFYWSLILLGCWFAFTRLSLGAVKTKMV